MSKDQISKYNLTIDEKIRLFNGDGSWRTYSANGKVPHIFMSDGPHGLRKQDFENYADLNQSNIATCFPTASCIASSWDPEIAAELGRAIATEARAEDVQLMLGPGMNIKRSPLCGRNFEYFSEDPFLTSRMAAAYVKGMQSLGVGACIKHFACNNQEKRRQTSSSNVDEKTLRKIYLSAFEYVVKNSKPAAVMCSYNKLNGTYTAHNRHLLTEILRDEWHYEGAVISDWGACIDAAACLKAGMDLAMPDSLGYFDKQLKAAYEKGEITDEDLDRANNRVIKMCEDLGGESLPLAPAAEASSATPSAGTPRNAPVDFTRQHQIALKLAEASAVLLKNDGFLPLETAPANGTQPSGGAPLFVIGELAEKMKYQGGGSSHITTAPYPNAMDSLSASGFDITYEPGYFSGFCKRSKAAAKNKPIIKAALTKLKATLQTQPDIPVLFFCGLTEAFEGEGFDRTDLQLPPEQLELLKEVLAVTKNVAIISFSGAPIDLQPALPARSILHMYLCGEACGEAVANLVTGKTNPSGKLAETWPLRIEDTPCYGNFAPEGDEVNYQEGELVGYRYYNAKGVPVLFEFGSGMSYTKFEFGVLSSEFLKDDVAIQNGKVHITQPVSSVTVKVKNAETRDGSEVVQVYYNGELCGFKKVFVKSGEEVNVVVECDCEPNCHCEEAKADVAIQNTCHCEQSVAIQKFTMASSLGDMAKASVRIRIFLKIIRFALICMNKKPAEDPSVKIAIAAIEENPVESLISTSGGVVSEKLARRLVKWAN